MKSSSLFQNGHILWVRLLTVFIAASVSYAIINGAKCPNSIYYVRVEQSRFQPSPRAFIITTIFAYIAYAIAWVVSAWWAHEKHIEHIDELYVSGIGLYTLSLVTLFSLGVLVPTIIIASALVILLTFLAYVAWSGRETRENVPWSARCIVSVSMTANSMWAGFILILSLSSRVRYNPRLIHN